MIFNWRKASVGTSLLLAAAALSAYAYTRANAPPTYHLANGVEVTPIKVQADDESRLLDVKIWKFSVDWPHGQGHFRVGLSLLQDGKLDKTIVGGLGAGLPYSQHSQVTLGLVPVAGTFTDSKQLKYNLSTNAAETERGEIPNPFIHAHGGTDSAQVIASENLAILMSGNLKKSVISGLPSANETALALDFTNVMPSK